MDALSDAIGAGVVRSCHDLSEGGLGVALAEMAFAGGVGADVDLGFVPVDGPIERSDAVLFSESPTRWICEVAPQDQGRFETLLRGVPHSQIGQTTKMERLRVRGLAGSLVVDLPLGELKRAWQGTLREV